MVQFSTLALALTAVGSVTAAPSLLHKRIAQVISDSTTKWEAACDAAGGGADCNQIAVNAFGTLLAAAGPCDQQQNADIMMDLSKKLNSADMIKFAQIWVQQPRNTPDSLSVQYCGEAPRNPELNGLFQCQFQGADPENFTGGLKAGDKGTIPFSHTGILNPSGSCNAHTSGPIADGTQLVDQVSSPGVVSGSGSDSGSTKASSSAPAGTSSITAPPQSSATAPPAASSSSSSSSSSPSSGSTGFAIENGHDAQALNKKFQGLTADNDCDEGEEACLGGSFAQCVQGKFVTTSCGSSLVCEALPLVNSRGTSITCTTEADAAARIAATGATGGITGDSNGTSTDDDPSNSSVPAVGNDNDDSDENDDVVTSTQPGAKSFALQNGRAAQALNKQFESLSPDNDCTDGEQACIRDAFAQCVGNKFVTTSCGATLTCEALPLVNSAGTSITCTTKADAQARIAATGATGGIDGSN